MYVLWYCSIICQELFTFIQIGCGHTVIMYLGNVQKFDYVIYWCSLSLHKLLWIAPELLRDETSRGSQKGDVYSFAIVVYEMFRRSETGNPYGELITLDKVIDLVKYPNGTKITRPDMKILSDPNLPVDVPDYVKGKTKVRKMTLKIRICHLLA